MLTTAFRSFGSVQNVKLVRDKGGTYACRLAVMFVVCVIARCRRAQCKVAHLSNFALYAVAYIKFEKASSAARAIEVMHEAVLNEGRGPLLKVFLAEAPSSRYYLG